MLLQNVITIVAHLNIENKSIILKVTKTISDLELLKTLVIVNIFLYKNYFYNKKN